MMIVFSVIGVVTVLGVIIIAAIEAKRMDKGEPSILSRLSKRRSQETQKKK